MGVFRTIAGLAAIYLAYLGLLAFVAWRRVPGGVDVGKELWSTVAIVFGVIVCISFIRVTRNYDEQKRVFQLAKRYVNDEISLDEYAARTKGILIP